MLSRVDFRFRIVRAGSGVRRAQPLLPVVAQLKPKAFPHIVTFTHCSPRRKTAVATHVVERLDRLAHPSYYRLFVGKILAERSNKPDDISVVV